MGADFTFNTHTLAMGASGILDLHSGATSGFLLSGSYSTGFLTVANTTGAVGSVATSGTKCYPYGGSGGTGCDTPSGGGSSVSINSTGEASPNFNDSTPSAGAGYQNIKWQLASHNVSAEVPIGSSSVFGLFKVDGTTITASSGVISTAGAPVNAGECETVVVGTGASYVLTTGDDTFYNGSCFNGAAGSLTITGVYCFSDTGTTTSVTPIIHGGGTILTGPLTCGNNAWSASGTLSGTPTIASGASLDPGMTTTGTAHTFHVAVTYHN
jgi:hypothetical protein